MDLQQLSDGESHKHPAQAFEGTLVTDHGRPFVAFVKMADDCDKEGIEHAYTETEERTRYKDDPKIANQSRNDAGDEDDCDSDQDRAFVTQITREQIAHQYRNNDEQGWDGRQHFYRLERNIRECFRHGRNIGSDGPS